MRSESVYLTDNVRIYSTVHAILLRSLVCYGSYADVLDARPPRAVPSTIFSALFNALHAVGRAMDSYLYQKRRPMSWTS